MLKHKLLRDTCILIVEPQSPLDPTDFSELVKEVDPYIEDHG